MHTSTRRLKNSRQILITGGNRGIGLAIARHFARMGDQVAVCSRSARNPALPKSISHARVDVRRRIDLERWVRKVRSPGGKPSVFINCAGISRWRPLHRINTPFVEEMINTNILGTFWGCAVAAQALGPNGSIVNISSLAGKRGSANNSVYCATKFAVNGITQSLAKELGPKGIRVNAVCPVYVKTPYILRSLSEPFSPAAGHSVSAYLSQFAKTQTALRRLPTELEIAEVVYFLASPAASAITGQCLNVDCGTLPQ